MFHAAVLGHGAPKGKRRRQFSIPAPKGQWEQQVFQAPTRRGRWSSGAAETPSAGREIGDAEFTSVINLGRLNAPSLAYGAVNLPLVAFSLFGDQ